MGGYSVRDFKARWVRVLEAHGVPEPDLSVKYIVEHILQNRRQNNVRFKQNLIIHPKMICRRQIQETDDEHF